MREERRAKFARDRAHGSDLHQPADGEIPALAAQLITPEMAARNEGFRRFTLRRGERRYHRRRAAFRGQWLQAKTPKLFADINAKRGIELIAGASFFRRCVVCQRGIEAEHSR